MSSHDVRWKQRLSNFKQALDQLSSAVALSHTRELSDLEKQGLIQAFEFTHELAWNVMRDYFAYQGNPSITGSRDAAREAFQKGLVQNGEAWMEMIRSRNQTSHTYNQAVASEIIEKTTGDYLPEFQAFFKKMIELSKK
ncbi:MAG: nucleotidyltransferase substrate binding protein [Oligoflexia bacterium]|nr:nucleotidyltransferase substrate binding protein [Oligoflexia bacterium]